MLRCTTGRRYATRSSLGKERLVRICRRIAHVGIQYGSQVQTPHEKVVPHVILSGNTLRRAKVGGKREVRRSRDVAADGGWVKSVRGTPRAMIPTRLTSRRGSSRLGWRDRHRERRSGFRSCQTPRRCKEATSIVGVACSRDWRMMYAAEDPHRVPFE